MVRPLTLVQPRHSYAPPPSVERFGDRVLPNTLLHVRARLMGAGITTHFIDHNVEPERQPETDIVGLTVLGMPYIPIVRAMAKKLLEQGHQVVIGGQVEGMIVRDPATHAITDRREFDAFFGANATIGNDWDALAKILQTDPEALAGSGVDGSNEKWMKTSLVPAYEALSEEELRFYLNGLVPFEIAQGCKEKCTFCVAAKNRKEMYRDTDVIERDLAWLLDKAKELSIESLNVYLTNLDLFQTPDKLSDFAKSVAHITKERQSVRLRMRGLCTVVPGFHTLHTERPELLHQMRDVGLEQIGAGVDGGTETVRKRVGKKGSEREVRKFIEESGKTYDISPQALMVYGHAGDTAETMQQANDFLQWANDEHGATPRPHCAKVLPGSLEWTLMRKKDWPIPFLYLHSEYCQAFDFCAAPSSLTHPDPTRRAMIERYFREGCTIGGTLTQLIEPMDPTLSLEENVARMLRNMRKYDV